MCQQLQATKSGDREVQSWHRWLLVCMVQALIVMMAVCCSAGDVLAFRVADLTESLGRGIFRWDANPRFVDGVERSLDGGLRYSVEGGSYEAFRDQFAWADPAPTAAEFQAAVAQAFAIWEAVDPATGLGTDLYFVPDFDTPIDIVDPPPETLEGRLRLNPGAEIDITSWSWPDFGGGQSDSYADPNSDLVTLTSGVGDYPATVSSGDDIRLSDGQGNPYTIQRFVSVLSHEIGHAIGLGHVDLVGGFGGFLSSYYDDNFDNSSRVTAHDTLMNSFAGLIDPLDPDNSPQLMQFEPCRGDEFCSPGIDTFGVDISMESTMTGGVLRTGLHHDDFAGRQFLYPFVRVRGDFDADKLVTAQDIDLLSAEVRASAPRTWFDLNDDSLVNEVDRVLWVESLGGASFGDADLNGKVEFADFVSLSRGYGREGGWADGDFDGSGDVNFPDVLLLLENFGGTAAEVATVPEPSAVALTFLSAWAACLARSFFRRGPARARGCAGRPEKPQRRHSPGAPARRTRTRLHQLPPRCTGHLYVSS